MNTAGRATGAAGGRRLSAFSDRGVRRAHGNSGSLITAAAVAAGVLAILVAGYLAYMGNEYSLNFRSHRWTQALHLAEGGIEVGFAELNNQYFKGGTGFTSARGWSSLGAGAYTKTITNFADNTGRPVGELTVSVSGVGTINPKILGVGTCATTPRGPIISRAVRVTLSQSSKFPVALMSRERLDLNGNNIYTDSFDSSDPVKSTSGLYDTAKKQANGDVASNDVLINTVNIGNADIYGLVSTGPGGTVAMGNNGSVGPTFVSADRAETVVEGEDNGWIRHDFSVDVPDVSLPGGMSSAPNIGTISGSTWISGGDWRIENINLDGSKTLTINGTVRLHVTGNTQIGGNAAIIINPGAKLEIYAAGDVSVAGNGVVNHTGLAANNQFYGLPGSDSWSISGNGQWVGTVYAPQADFTMNGGGAAGDMSGSVVAKSITLNGEVTFHYDEALRGGQFAAGYLVSTWQSLKQVSGNWVAD